MINVTCQGSPAGQAKGQNSDNIGIRHTSGYLGARALAAKSNEDPDSDVLGYTPIPLAENVRGCRHDAKFYKKNPRTALIVA